jgi:steroid 5-alpha reductase family enzyme
VDIFWGIWFIIISWILLYFWEKNIPQILVWGLVTIWWFRLAWYIFFKKIKKSWEDPRYKKWRSEWKYFYTRSFFQVFLLQMLLMILISIPLFLIFQNIISFNIIFTIWIVIALIGLIYETIADIQKSKFLKIRKQWDILTSWLFKFSRYPNYFGESLFWFGISIIWLQISILSIIWWIIITLLLLFVSGIPMIEERYKDDKNYQKYKQKTNAFIPFYKKIWKY